MRAAVMLPLLLVSLISWTNPASAQDEPTEAQRAFQAIGWEEGPMIGKLGSVGEVRVPEGFIFTGKAGAQKFLELTQNPSSGDELGVIMPTDSTSWFAVFEFDEVGFIKDDDRDELDPDKLLASIREGTNEANKERAKKGWSSLEIVGWHQKPTYDPVTNNLVWSIRGRSEGEESINFSTRVLGRRGVMRTNLVMGPEEIDAAVPRFNAVLAGFTFGPGGKYAEFKQGDKIAEYGLAALVTGGVAVAAAKSGLLAKFGKLLFFIAIGFLGVAGRFFGAIKRMFTGGSKEPNA